MMWEPVKAQRELRKTEEELFGPDPPSFEGIDCIDTSAWGGKFVPIRPETRVEIARSRVHENLVIKRAS